MAHISYSAIVSLTRWSAGVLTAFALLLGWDLTKPTAAVASNQVQLVVGGRVAPFVVPPYIDSDGEIMAPVDFVRLLGANYSVGQNSTLVITSASGKSFSLVFKHLSDRLMIPLQSTAESLGASATWSPSTNTVILRSKLEVARVDDDNVVIATSYPVYYKTQSLENPPRLVVDLFGADLDSPPAIVPAENANVTQIRSGQLDDETVRLVLDLSHQIKYSVASPLQTNAIMLALNTTVTDTTPIPVIDPASSAPDVNQVAAASPPVIQSRPIVPPGLIPLPSLSHTGAAATPTAPVKIINVEYKSVNSEVSQVIVTTAGPINVSEDSYKSYFLTNPNRLAFEVSGASLSVDDAFGHTIDSLVPDANPLFRTIYWAIDNADPLSSGRVLIDLQRPIVYTVSTDNLDDNSGVQYIINIQQSAVIPDNGPGNSIAGKIVIVDPGHGGKDSGAPGREGIYEKNFVLAIGKLVRDALTAAGATAIMTRSDDTFIPLDARSQLGIDSHADYYISIHADSCGQQNSHSGDTVYYHGSQAICRDMAKAIANRLAQLDISIQSDGVRSDYVRFPGIGFSVLRKSPEPAVLVECGYVNDDADAKCLEDPSAQQELATAIVAGLRDFVANQ